jgi:DNA-binding NarL/FixJ family response regulator
MTHPLPVRILVVDDHNLFRRGLIALLSRDARLSVVAEAGDAGEALRVAKTHQPDVILLDNHLPGVHGVDALPQLYAAAPSARIVMLTVSEDADDLALALSRGAAGYLLKTIEGDALADAIMRVLAGESVVSPEMTSKLIAQRLSCHRLHPPRRPWPLSMLLHRPMQRSHASHRASTTSCVKSPEGQATRRSLARWALPRPR